MLDIAIHIFKYLALAVTAAMAIVSLVKKTRSESGDLTVAGKKYLNLLIVSSSVAVLTQILGDIREARSTSEQLRRNNELLEEVIKGQYPLEGIRASYQARIPDNAVGIDRYKERLSTARPQIISHISAPLYRQQNGIRAAVTSPTTIFLFCGSSPFLPSAPKEADAARLVSSVNVRLLFYRTPVQPAEWPMFVYTGTTSVQPDIEMWFSGGDRCIEYRDANQQLTVENLGASTDSRQWQNSGSLVSVLDLRGAQMVIDISPRKATHFNTQPELQEFELFVGSLQALWFPKERFVSHSLPNGDVAYEFIFPKTLDEILALQRRYRKHALETH